jgi:hypothetical protein
LTYTAIGDSLPSIDTIVGLVGVLGFLLSVFVFVLTRWERRKRAEIELFRGDLQRIDPDFTTETVEPDSMIGFRLINIGTRPIAVDKNSLTFSGNGRMISVHETDWAGLDRVPSPLPPNSSFEVGVFQDAFETMLGVNEFRELMKPEDSDKCIINVRAAVKDVEGKTFSTKNRHQYSFSVSEFWPAQHVGS